MEYISSKHVFVKEGIYYFTRRVPVDLREHYSSQKISYSLRTRSSSIARARANTAACKLDEYWYHLRSRNTEIPGKHMLLHGLSKPASAHLHGKAVNLDAIKLSEAASTYLRLKGSGKSKTFHRAVHRACGYVIDTCEDKPLPAYSKADANAFRDSLVGRGLAGSSITRIFGTVRSVFNFVASEEGLTITNPFANVYYDRDAGVSDRLPMPVETIRKVQQKCYEMDDELRWLVALVSDTGMRLAEAAGLLRDDLHEDEDGNLTVSITPHPWRRLKTKGSERIVPLAGASAWAGKRILDSRAAGEFAFPRYNRSGGTNANSASAALGSGPINLLEAVVPV